MALQEELERQGNFLFKYRGTLPIVLLIVSIIFFSYVQYYNLEYDRLISYDIYQILALFIAFLGLAIRVFTVGYSAKNTSGRNTEQQIANTVNQTGIYSIVRHPLYLGNFLMWLAPALLVQNFWFIVAFIFIYWVYYERIMFAEEQFLRAKFGEVYLKWAEKTPAFIPSFKNYVPPIETFSWKKVIRQEKNGFLAIFVVFFLFKAIKYYIEKDQVVENFLAQQKIILFDWLFYLTIFSLLFYIVVKIILKKSNLLDDKR